jgi:hypothetical protein
MRARPIVMGYRSGLGTNAGRMYEVSTQLIDA